MKQYFILFRPYGMLFLGLTPFFGAITNGEYNPLNLIILCVIGFLVHIFTFVQNDYYDIEVDQKSKYVKNRPLSSGTVSKKNVVNIFISAFVISLIICIFYLFTFYSFFVLILSFLCMTLYNRYSKKLAGMEFILSLGVFGFSVFGALTVSNTLSPLASSVALFVFLQWLFSVGVAANLKDVKFDTQQGIKTTPVLFGTQVYGKKLIIPSKFKIYAFLIKIIHILVGLIILLFGSISISWDTNAIPATLFFIVSLLVLYCTYKILSTPLIKRDTMLIYIGLQEGLSFLLLPISLMGYLIIQTSLFSTILLLVVMIIWPLFWFRILFGKHMIPLE